MIGTRVANCIIGHKLKWHLSAKGEDVMDPVFVTMNVTLPESQGNFDDAAAVAVYIGLPWHSYIRRCIYTMVVESGWLILPGGMNEQAIEDIQRAAKDLAEVPTVSCQETLEIPEPEPTYGPSLAVVEDVAKAFKLERDAFFSACVLAYTRRGLEVLKNPPPPVRSCDLPEEYFTTTGYEDEDDE